MTSSSTTQSKHGFRTQLEDSRLGTDSSEPFDLCVVCRRPTEFRKSDPVRNRRYYIEGAGQLCSSCGERLYPFGTSCEMGNPPTAAHCRRIPTHAPKGGEDSNSF